MNSLQHRRLAYVEPLMREGDLLLYRRRGLISIAGRGEHSHAAVACGTGPRLLLVEVTAFHGGRSTLLAHRVAAAPGRWDWYQANPDGHWTFDRWATAQKMMSLRGCKYGWAGLCGAALLHLPIVRLFVPPSYDDQALDRRPPFCSQAVAWATRTGGGVDPVPHLADRLTEPADLARSAFYRYRCTLLP